MDHFGKLMGVLADNPSIAGKIITEHAPSDGMDLMATDPAKITAGLLGLAQEHGIALTETQLRQGLIRIALDQKAGVAQMMSDQDITMTEAELEQGLALAAREDGTLSDADLDQVTGGVLLETLVVCGIFALAAIPVGGMIAALALAGKRAEPTKQ